MNITNCIETIKTVADKTCKYMHLYVDVHVWDVHVHVYKCNSGVVTC